MKFKIYLLSLIAIGMASFLLINFGLIWAYGKFYIYESNPVVLIGETFLIGAFLVFSFYCLIEQVQSIRKSAKNNDSRFFKSL